MKSNHKHPKGASSGFPKKDIKMVCSPLELQTHLASLKQPDGEDFFVFQVRIDDPSDPCWDEGFSVMGCWQHLMRTLPVQLICLGTEGKRCIVRTFQGERARTALQNSLKDELRYQEQKNAQPHN